MTINLKIPDIRELKPRITVFGVGGAGGNAVNNMINAGLEGVEFVVANTDAQALTMSQGRAASSSWASQVTEGLGAGSQPEVGRAAAEECIDEIIDHLDGAHMCFVTAGMGGGTGTGAAPVIARAAREQGILTVGVVTKPFHFEGQRRMRRADDGHRRAAEVRRHADRHPEPEPVPGRQREDHLRRRLRDGRPGALLGRRLHHRPDGQGRPDQPRLRRRPRGDARDGQGDDGHRRSLRREARAWRAAEAAIANPLLDDVSMKGAKGLLISITGGTDLTLFEVDEAANRIREEVDQDANIIVGATFDESLEGIIRVSVVATGIDKSRSQPGATAGRDAHPELSPAAARADRASGSRRAAIAAQPTQRLRAAAGACRRRSAGRRRRRMRPAPRCSRGGRSAAVQPRRD